MLSFFETVFKILIFFSALFFLITPVDVPAADDFVVTHGVINSWKLNLRRAQSNDSDVVKILEKGMQVKILGYHGGIGGWLEISYKQVKGYIRNRPKYVTLVKNDLKKRTGRGGTKTEKKQKTQKKRDGTKAEKIEKIQAKIIRQKKKNDLFTQKEAEIIEGLNEIDKLLNTIRIKIAAISAELESIKSEISTASAARVLLADKIDKNREYVKARVKALYRIRKVGRMEFFSMPDSLFDFFLQQNALKRILLSDFNLLDMQINDVEKLEHIVRQLGQQKKDKLLVDARLTDQIRLLNRESKKKKSILKEIREKTILGAAAVASLKEAAVMLEKKISRIQAESTSSGDGDLFTHYQNKLKMPVSGEIISMFGPSRNSDYSSFTFQSGIDIRVDRGEPVRSVFKGRILYAQWLKGYGNIIIIDHGDNYYTLYAHVEEFFKKRGELVGTSEVIATAGDTGSMEGVCLHFEIRHHGKPVNPLKWLKQGA
ncbi:MAG: peptidoglycan DD-metalloendopeptidase family protein [Thermodesulfobacteriota bacterium]|nr:peptidoglycan DD-metalloendopeptidase family protein [Thermodesulfobacteriota bacterium]